MQPYLLGIDIGTGSTKAVAAYANGKAFDTVQYHYPVKSPQPGYSEQDPELILAAFLNCITDMVAKTGQSPIAISLSCAFHGLLPVDSTGKPLTDMITWADARAEKISQTLRESPSGPEIYETCGTPIHAMTPICKLIWLRENQPELFAQTHKFISAKEYVWYHLFGDYQVDYSLASATGLFDIKKLAWHPNSLLLAGISTAQLSQPVNTTYKRTGLNAEVAESLNLDINTPFIAGAGDGICAHIGSFVSAPGTASLTIGTSGAVRITSLEPVINDEAMVFNYLLDEKTYISGGAVNNGGIALNWLIKNFLNIQSPTPADYDAVFAQMAAIPAGSDGLIFLPYLYGERAPLWDTQTCGVFFKIKPQHTQAHFLRAGLEGICQALNHVLQTLENSAEAIHQLNISGGFITSKVWTQMLADITGKKLVIVQQEDASAMGAIFLAMDALGLSRSEGVLTDEEVAILPDEANHLVYQKSFEVFKRLYVELKEVMHWVGGM